MTDNPYLEASKFHTQVRREVKRHREAQARELNNHEARMLELRQALSPAAARIVVAAEESEVERIRDFGQQAVKQMQEKLAEIRADPNPAPAWLNQEPAPLPAGALLEVPEKPARRRA